MTAERPAIGSVHHDRVKRHVAGVGHQVAVGHQRAAAVEAGRVAVLTSAIAGVWTAGMVTDVGPVTSDPLGGVPVAVPVLVIAPALRSAWVVV